MKVRNKVKLSGREVNTCMIVVPYMIDDSTLYEYIDEVSVDALSLHINIAPLFVCVNHFSNIVRNHFTTNF